MKSLPVFVFVGLFASAIPAFAQTKDFTVAGPTRLDWAFAVRGFGKDAAKLPARYSSAAQKYQLFVPKTYKDTQAWPLVVFISPDNQPTGFAAWKKVCESEGVFFCSPYEAGNNVTAGQRARIVLDMADDVRKKYRIDPNQTYIGGFSGGGRMACSIGFALPEYFAGIVPVCGTNPITGPTYLRHRLVDRVSVAFVTGEKDFNRKENEVAMAPLFLELGIRSKLWVTPGLGHGIPGPDVMETVYAWLKEDTSRRSADAKARPDLAIGPTEGPDISEQAKRLLATAEKELQDKTRVWHGVALLQGILARFDKTRSGMTTASLLKKISNDERLLELISDQGGQDEVKFLSAQAKSLERFGDLPRAIESWDLLARNYEGTPIANNAQEQIRRLRALKK